MQHLIIYVALTQEWSQQVPGAQLTRAVPHDVPELFTVPSVTSAALRVSVMCTHFINPATRCSYERRYHSCRIR